MKITAISREKTKKTALILATSKQTGEVLRCDVILDTISQLEVHTTTRRLYLEEAPEKFVLNAKDSEGNDFSTLEGVEFNWMLGSQSRNTRDTDEHARQQVLRFLTFSESVYHNVSLLSLLNKYIFPNIEQSFRSPRKSKSLKLWARKGTWYSSTGLTQDQHE